MTSCRRFAHVVIGAGLAACATAGGAATAGAQAAAAADSVAGPSTDTTARRSACYRGQPLPRCRSFIIFELGMATRLVGTVHEVSYWNASGAYSTRDPDSQQFLAYEVGVMTNRDSTHANGFTLRLATGDGGSVAVKTRRRRWLANDRTFDLSAGPMIGLVKSSTSTTFQGSSGIGLTGEVTVGSRDAAAISLGADAMRGGGRTVATVHAGARLGSHLAVIGSAALVTAVLVMAAAMTGGI